MKKVRPDPLTARRACGARNRLYPVFRRVETGFRFYDPNLQRWLSRDPLGNPGSLVFLTEKNSKNDSRISELIQMLESSEDGFVHVNANLYKFVDNNPVTLFDPDGLDPAFSPDIGMFSGLSPAQQECACKTAAPATLMIAGGAAFGVVAAELEAAGVISTAAQGNNVFRVMCKPLRRGLRLDKPHHGKWYHFHWWKW